MALGLELHQQDGAARLTTLHLPHAVVDTPVFMPVGTSASVKAVPQATLESLGAQIILANTYHLYLRPGHEVVRRLGGLHRFMSWPHALLTDSGGFQVFSLSKIRKVTPEGVNSARIWTAASIFCRRSAPLKCSWRWARTSLWPLTNAPNIRPTMREHVNRWT